MSPGPSPVLSVPFGSIPGSVCALWVHPCPRLCLCSLGPSALPGPSPALSVPFGAISVPHSVCGSIYVPRSVCALWVHLRPRVRPRLCLCPLGPSVSPTLCPLGPSPVLSVPIGSIHIPGSVCALWVHPRFCLCPLGPSAPVRVSVSVSARSSVCAPSPSTPPSVPPQSGPPRSRPAEPTQRGALSAAPRFSPRRAALRSAPLRSALLFRRSVASRPQRSPVCTARRVRAPTVGDDVQ